MTLAFTAAQKLAHLRRHPELRNQYMRTWRRNHPHASAANMRAYRRRKLREAEIRSARASLLLKHEMRCCGVQINASGTHSGFDSWAA